SKFSPPAKARSSTATRPSGGGGRFPGCSTYTTRTVRVEPIRGGGRQAHRSGGAAAAIAFRRLRGVLYSRRHAQPARRAPQRGPGHREAGEGCGARPEEARGHGEAEAGGGGGAGEAPEPRRA